AAGAPRTHALHRDPVREVRMRVRRSISTLSLWLLASCVPSEGPPPTRAQTDPSIGASRSDAEGRDSCDDERGDRDGDCRSADIEQVLLISIEGIHQIDLARFTADHPDSNLARLARTGVEFTNAWVNRLDGTPTNPSDSFPGLLALTTGGSSPT